MRNFVVYYHEELNLMFHHWEYVGNDFAADMAKCDNDPISKLLPWCYSRRADPCVCWFCALRHSAELAAVSLRSL